MTYMDAKSTPTLPGLDQVLNQLYGAAGRLKASTKQEVEVTYYCEADYPEEMNKYIEASDFLKKKEAIVSYKIGSSGEDEVMVLDSKRQRSSPRDRVFCEVTYSLVPQTLIDFMIENSYLPKYSLKLAENGELILNDKYLLIKVQLDRINHQFIEYALEHPNKIIKADNIFIGEGKRKKRFHHIVEELIKNYELRRVFFPHVKKKGSCKFRNNVMQNVILEDRINEKGIAKFIKKLKSPSPDINWSR